MVDSKAKGRTAEIAARDALRKLTPYTWERTPLSGALSSNHKLKGDLYIPETKLIYCVEVKHYKDDHISTKLLTSKSPQFVEWWEQTVREAGQMDKLPLLLFKHNRSKWFAAFDDIDVGWSLIDCKVKHMTYMYNGTTIYICNLEKFCEFVGDWVE